MSLIVAAPSRFEGQPLPLVELVQKSQSAGTRERCSCQGCPSVPLPRPSEGTRAPEEIRYSRLDQGTDVSGLTLTLEQQRLSSQDPRQVTRSQ